MRAYARPRISPAYKAICAGQAVARQQTLARTLPLLVGLSSLNLTILVISWLFRKKEFKAVDRQFQLYYLNYVRGLPQVSNS